MAEILRVSDAAALALHSMTILAAKKDNVVSTTELAQTLQASQAHLLKVLQRLARVGLVESVRGPKGGFILSKASDDITLLEVYEAVEGPFKPSNCLFSRPVCGGDGCLMGELLHDINGRLRGHLAKTKLSELVRLPWASAGRNRR